MFAGKKSAQIREILISESAWEEMTCLFAPSLTVHSPLPISKYAVTIVVDDFITIFKPLIKKILYHIVFVFVHIIYIDGYKKTKYI